MIKDTFALKVKGTQAFLKCNKFDAFKCLSFITKIIRYLPENSSDWAFSRKGAEAIIMSVMDTGIEVKLSQEQKDKLKLLSIEQDYFAQIFKLSYLNSEEDKQIELANELLKLYLYNNQILNIEIIDTIFDNPKILFNALLHVIRYNYNDFFIIDGH